VEPDDGCDRISPGCDNCYALTLAKRLKAMGQAKYQCDGDPRTSGPGFGVTVHEDALGEPPRWRQPRKVFVNSMSDISGGVTILVSSFPQLRAYALSFLRLRHVSRPGVSASLQQFGDPVGRDVEIVDDVQASAAPIGGLKTLRKADKHRLWSLGRLTSLTYPQVAVPQVGGRFSCRRDEPS
jgi:Protein of unknown function (DUF5131)